MKMTGRFTAAVSILVAAVLLFFTGCKKEADDPTGSENNQTRGLTTPITDKDQQIQVEKAIENMPGIAVYNEPSDRYILMDLNGDQQKFNFSNPGGGIIFSSPDGSVEFVEGVDGGYYQVVGGSGGGGGLITAGDIALNVNYVVCFASGDGGENDFFGLGSGFQEFAGAVGIAGDFDALMNDPIDDDADPFDFFQGFVAFYIFDGSPNGEYEVYDWLEAQSDEPDLDDSALAYFISFQDDEAAIFFGVDGNVSASGNQIGFQGTYAGLIDVSISFDGTDEPEDPDFVEAEGSGFLTCQ